MVTVFEASDGHVFGASNLVLLVCTIKDCRSPRACCSLCTQALLKAPATPGARHKAGKNPIVINNIGFSLMLCLHCEG